MGDLENKNVTSPGPHRFKKGESGNPAGRPKVIKDFREACQKFLLLEGGFEKIKAFTDSKDERVAMDALKFMTQYALGRAPEYHTIVAGGLQLDKLDTKGLDDVLVKAINGDIQLSKEQLAALRMALQKSGDLPDPFNQFRISYGPPPNTEPKA